MSCKDGDFSVNRWFVVFIQDGANVSKCCVKGWGCDVGNYVISCVKIGSYGMREDYIIYVCVWVRIGIYGMREGYIIYVCVWDEDRELWYERRLYYLYVCEWG